MTDILDIGANMEAVEAAERGNFEPLATMVLAGKPLGDTARRIIAGRLTGKFKAKRGTKPKNETVTADKDTYLEFLHLQQSVKYPSDAAVYALIAQRYGQQIDRVEKAIKAGRQATSKAMRGYNLDDTRAS